MSYLNVNPLGKAPASSGQPRLAQDVSQVAGLVLPVRELRTGSRDVLTLAIGAEEPERGRPTMDPSVVQLIRRMCGANPFWGAPRIHGELLKLGLEPSHASLLIEGRSRWTNHPAAGVG